MLCEQEEHNAFRGGDTKHAPFLTLYLFDYFFFIPKKQKSDDTLKFFQSRFQIVEFHCARLVELLFFENCTHSLFKSIYEIPIKITRYYIYDRPTLLYTIVFFKTT